MTPANPADNEVTPRLLPDLPPELRFLLGDTNDDAPALREQRVAASLALVTSRHGRYPHTDAAGWPRGKRPLVLWDNGHQEGRPPWSRK